MPLEGSTSYVKQWRGTRRTVVAREIIDPGDRTIRVDIERARHEDPLAITQGSVPSIRIEIPHRFVLHGTQ